MILIVVVGKELLFISRSIGNYRPVLATTYVQSLGDISKGGEPGDTVLSSALFGHVPAYS